MVGTINIKPPIVGVPSFPLCLDKKTLTVCFIFIFLSSGIKTTPNIIDNINPIINASTAFAKINTSSSPIIYFLVLFFGHQNHILHHR